MFLYKDTVVAPICCGRLQLVTKIARLAPPSPFPSYSVLIASFVAHFWSALPDMAFQARHNTETVGGRMRVTFKLAKSFLGTFF